MLYMERVENLDQDSLATSPVTHSGLRCVAPILSLLQIVVSIVFSTCYHVELTLVEGMVKFLELSWQPMYL